MVNVNTSINITSTIDKHRLACLLGLSVFLMGKKVWLWISLHCGCSGKPGQSVIALWTCCCPQLLSAAIVECVCGIVPFMLLGARPAVYLWVVEDGRHTHFVAEEALPDSRLYILAWHTRKFISKNGQTTVQHDDNSTASVNNCSACAACAWSRKTVHTVSK